MGKAKFSGSRRTVCAICGREDWCEPHHVFGGTSRHISDQWGAVAYCCRTCHEDFHQHPANYKWLREETQKRVMAEQGWSMDDWMRIFFKNYID
ncbi:MAG: hypothetical protein IJ091_11245 [Oscillospiraceae bacterium]|nr:hypothetical protein [Oscillospiraceae bacterium]MBQ8996374.1 hypothetical protein [Oscillospiraceae bacterium]